MANNHFLSYIYGYSLQNNDAVIPLGGTTGLLNSFPSAGTRFYPTTGTINGATIVSVIELLPTGLNKDPLKFYTDKTVTDLNTAAT